MSVKVKTGWLKDNNGEYFAPKTLASQIQTDDGTALEDKIAADLDAVLPVAGGTMTGELVLAGDPTEELHAATKQYVDTKIDEVSSGGYIEFTITEDNRAMIGFTGEEDEELIIPSEFVGSDGALYKVIEIGTNAFQSCDSLISVTIPNSVIYINAYAFQNCSSLNRVFIPDGVIAIGDHAFENCSTLTYLIIPDSIQSIGNYAFSCCVSLKNVVIPKSVIYLGNSAFSSCSSLQKVEISYDIMLMEYGVFSSCTELAEVILSGTMRVIPHHTFEECRSLTNVIIPNGVNTIDEAAFYKCSSLKYIAIPASVTSIGNNAFAYCDALSTIHYSGTESEWNSINDIADGLASATVHFNYKIDTNYGEISRLREDLEALDAELAEIIGSGVIE